MQKTRREGLRLSERRLTAHRRNTGMLMKTIIVAGMNKAVHRAVFQLCERLLAYCGDNDTYRSNLI